MKFRDYVEQLQKLLEERPELGDATAVYAKDDEGNGYQEICFFSTPGYFDTENQEFMNEEDFDDPEELEFFPDAKLNAVIVN